MLRVKFVWKMFLCPDIHVTFTEGRGCVAEGKGKKKKEANAKKAVDLGGRIYCSKLFDLVQPWNIRADVDFPTSQAQFCSQVRSASGRLFMFSAVKVSERARALLVSPAKKIDSSDVILARISCFLNACVVGCVCRRELSKFVKQTNNGKNSDKRQ